MLKNDTLKNGTSPPGMIYRNGIGPKCAPDVILLNLADELQRVPANKKPLFWVQPIFVKQ